MFCFFTRSKSTFAGKNNKNNFHSREILAFIVVVVVFSVLFHLNWVLRDGPTMITSAQAHRNELNKKKLSSPFDPIPRRVRVHNGKLICSIVQFTNRRSLSVRSPRLSSFDWLAEIIFLALDSISRQSSHSLETREARKFSIIATLNCRVGRFAAAPAARTSLNINRSLMFSIRTGSGLHRRDKEVEAYDYPARIFRNITRERGQFFRCRQLRVQ